MKQTERGEQIALIQKCRLLSSRYPALGLLYHVPNGGKKERKKTRYGYELSEEGMTLQRMGVLPGVPDLCLPVPGDGYHALYIEMKTRTGKVRTEQLDVQDRLRRAGNRVVVCRSVEEAWRMIKIHLGIEEDTGE